MNTRTTALALSVACLVGGLGMGRPDAAPARADDGAVIAPVAEAAPEVDWLWTRGNERLARVDNAGDYTRMWRDISNSRLIDTQPYLDGAVYLQRRTNFVNNYREHAGEGELYTDWLGPARVSVGEGLVVIVAVLSAGDYGEAGDIHVDGLRDDERDALVNEGWLPLGDSIGVHQIIDHQNLSYQYELFAARVPAGPVFLYSEAIDRPLRTVFFFQHGSTFGPEVLDRMKTIEPEPGDAFRLVFAPADPQRG